MKLTCIELTHVLLSKGRTNKSQVLDFPVSNHVYKNKTNLVSKDKKPQQKCILFCIIWASCIDCDLHISNQINSNNQWSFIKVTKICLI